MMSEKKHESLSAFIDGEISDGSDTRVLDDVLADESLSRRWASYHLIGDIMRRHAHSRPEGDAAMSVDDIATVRAIKPHRTALGPVGGLALAASVALVAILGIHVLGPGDISQVPTSAVVTGVSTAGPAPVVADAGSASGEASSALPVRRTTAAALPKIPATRLTWNDAAPAVANRLNGYLVTHNEHLVNGMRGMLPYARIVAYDGRGN